MWKIHPDVAFVDDGHRVAALRLAEGGSGEPLILDGSAATIWRAVQSHHYQDSVIEAVAEAFGTEVEKVGADALQFLEDLRSKDLIIREGGPGEADPNRALRLPP